MNRSIDCENDPVNFSDSLGLNMDNLFNGVRTAFELAVAGLAMVASLGPILKLTEVTLGPAFFFVRFSPLGARPNALLTYYSAASKSAREYAVR